MSYARQTIEMEKAGPGRVAFPLAEEAEHTAAGYTDAAPGDLVVDPSQEAGDAAYARAKAAPASQSDGVALAVGTVAAVEGEVAPKVVSVTAYVNVGAMKLRVTFDREVRQPVTLAAGQVLLTHTNGRAFRNTAVASEANNTDQTTIGLTIEDTGASAGGTAALQSLASGAWAASLRGTNGVLVPAFSGHALVVNTVDVPTPLSS